MSAFDWKMERNDMRDRIKLQFKNSLRKIAEFFESSGESVDMNIYNEYFHLTIETYVLI